MQIYQPFPKILKFIQTEITFQKNRPKRILFDHLPKCAGTTITEYLTKHFPARLIFNTNLKKSIEAVEMFKDMPRESRFKFQLILGHLTHHLLEYVHPDTLAVTIFRDPVERTISHYNFVLRKKEHYLHDWVVTNGIQLKDYCYCPLTGELRNWYTTHYTNQTIRDAEKNGDDSVQRAFAAITSIYDVIGFQDDVPSFIEEVKRKANLNIPFDNLQRNSKPNHHSAEIPEDVREQIKKINFLDVQLFSLLKKWQQERLQKVRVM